MLHLASGPWPPGEGVAPAGGLSAGVRLAGLALAVLLGCAWQVSQPRLWPPGWHVALTVLGAAGTLAGGWRVGLMRPAGVGRLLAWGLCWGALAAGSAGWRAEGRLAARLPAALEGVELLLVGRVVGLPRPSAQGPGLLLEVTQALDAAGRPVSWGGGRVWLGGGGAQDGAGDASGAAPARVWPQAGERWQLPARLRQPHGLLNPGGWDAEGWMFEQGIVAIGSVRSSSAPAAAGVARRLTPAPGVFLEGGLDALRQALRDRILLSVPDVQAAGVLAALAVGDQAAIPPRTWEVLRDAGVAHLASISGLHITLFAWLVTAGLRRLWPLLPAALLRRLHWPAPLLARWGGLLLALLYAVLAGWGVPAQRTVWMLAVGTLLMSLGRRWPGWLVCCVSGATVLLADPWAVTQPGFWLSFVAVLLLMWSDPPAPPLAPPATGAAAGLAPQGAGALPAPAPPGRWRHLLDGRVGRALRQAVQAQLVASIGLAPLSLLLFNQVSLVGLGVNLLAVPLVTLVITPLALLGMVAPPLWQLAGALLPVLLDGLAWAARQPGAVWQVAALAWPWLLLPLAGAVWLVLPLPWPRRWPALLLWLPLGWPGTFGAADGPVSGDFELLAVDVGQGSAVLVRTAGHALLFDAGPAWPGGDAGTRTLLPLLAHLGVRRLDALILSHEDTDHAGGAAALLERLPVELLLGSLPPAHPLWRAGPRVGQRQACRAGQVWQWEGVSFRILHPAAAGAAAPGPDPANARSCVLKVTDARGRSALLTGDIGQAQEQALAQADAAALRAEVLVVPHHGSRSSSSPALLAAVQPRWALVQVGYRSRFGHPHPEVLARYAHSGIKLVRTDEAGALRWRDSELTCTRVVMRRVWHWSGAPDAC